jgi:Phage conserved hypothetical protein BR0599
MIYLYQFQVSLNENGFSSSNFQSPADTRLEQLYLMTNLTVDIEGQYLLELPAAPSITPIHAGDEQAIYKSTAIEHEEVRMDGERQAGQLKITLPADHPIAQLYLQTSPSLRTTLALSKYDNATFTTPFTEAVWIGQVTFASFDEFRCTLTLDHVQKLLVRNGLTAKHPRSCPSLLYDKATCGVKASKLDGGYWQYREDGFISSISPDGFDVVIAEAANKPAGWFTHGFVVAGGVYTLDGNGQEQFVTRTSGGAVDESMSVYSGFRRTVISQDGGAIRLANPMPPSVKVGDRVTLFAGCNGAIATCNGKFNNVPRYKGYPYIPIKNAFEVGVKAAGEP